MVAEGRHQERHLLFLRAGDAAGDAGLDLTAEGALAVRAHAGSKTIALEAGALRVDYRDAGDRRRTIEESLRPADDLDPVFAEAVERSKAPDVDQQPVAARGRVQPVYLPRHAAD